MLTQEDLMAIKELFTEEFAVINQRLEKVELRLEKIEQHLAVVDQRLDKVEQRLDKVELRLDKVESEVSSLKAGQLQMHQEIKNISRKVDATYELALDNWGQIVESKNRLDILEA